MVWKVLDSAEAVYNVDDYESFVHIQAESALRAMATAYPYDPTAEHPVALRSHATEISHDLAHQLSERLNQAGIEVLEARISHLAYAPEIAGAMLQRQQAGAIIAARERLVEGAVGMVQLALNALSAKGDFDFLKSDMMPAIQSESGKKHLWLWLTKRPNRMAEFADEIGGFPDNVCAMTTVTGAGPDQMERIDHLRRVKAACRGLSIEPLWERIPTRNLNLKGIDWVIVGGESGSGDTTRPFAVEWAEELRDHCKKQGVAFFLKQLGRNPTRNDRVMKLHDRHGGDWKEWENSLRVREFPKHFHRFRAEERRKMSRPIRPRPGP